jgi:Tol biopolymer transport system component
MRPQSISTVLSLSFLVAAICLGNDVRKSRADRNITDETALIREAPVPLPGYLESFIEPNFKTKITRISKTLTTDTRISWGDTVRHHYSKDQAWSARMSHMLIQNRAIGSAISASPSYLLLNGQNYTFDESLNISPDEIRWHPTDDNVMIYTKRNSLYRYRVAENSSELIHTFTEYPNNRFAIAMLWEGNLSFNGRMISFLSRMSNGTYDIYSYDMETGSKGTVRNFSSKPDWVSSSPSGKYVVLNWIDRSTENSDVYDKNMKFIRRLPVEISHYDMTFDDDGVTEIAVGTAKPSGGGKLIKVPLVSGGSTVLTDRGWVDHTSTRNIVSGKWAIGTFMEQNASSSSDRKFLNEIVAVKLDGSGEVRRLAHTRCKMGLGRAAYPSETQASVSPDGTKVIFASNWRQADGVPINAFVVDLGDLLSGSR